MSLSIIAVEAVPAGLSLVKAGMAVRLYRHQSRYDASSAAAAAFTTAAAALGTTRRSDMDDQPDVLPEDPFDKLGREVGRLGNVGRTNRLLLKVLAFSVALDIGLSIGFGVLAINANHTASVVKHNTASVRVDCRASNASNIKQEQLWNYILTLTTSAPPRPGETQADTDARHQQATQFKIVLDRIFTQRACPA